MALFKIFKGSGTLENLNAKRPSTVEGYCYFTPEDGKFYIDTYTDVEGEATGTNPTHRVVLNAETADRAYFYGGGGVGSSTQPIYIAGSGQPISCDDTLAVNISGKLKDIQGNFLNIGDAQTPIYFLNGGPEECGNNLNVNITGNAATATQADEAIHADSATEADKAAGAYYLLSQETNSSLDIGNINIPVYFNNGIPVLCEEISAIKLGSIQNNNGIYSITPYTIGSSEKPVYFENGIPKECGKLKLNAAGNEMLPVYINEDGQAEVCNQFLPLSAGKDYILTGPLGLGFNQNYGISLPETAFDGQIFFVYNEYEPQYLPIEGGILTGNLTAPCYITANYGYDDPNDEEATTIDGAIISGTGINGALYFKIIEED